MSGKCKNCDEHCLECKCKIQHVDITSLDEMPVPILANYYLMMPSQEEIKVWAQMFFNDGSVTPGKYIGRTIFDIPKYIAFLAREFLNETCRKEGILFIWGAGRVYARKAELFLPTRGTFKGRETLRLRRL